MRLNEHRLEAWPQSAPNGAQMKSETLQRILQPMRWILLVAILTTIIGYLARHPDEWAVLGQVDATAFLVVCLLQAGSVAAQGAQLHVIIETVSGTVIGARVWQRIFWTSRFMNLFVPQSGTLYRAVRLKQGFGVAYVDYAGGFMMFLWLSILITAAVALAVVLPADHRLTLFGMDGRLVLALLLAVVLAVPPTLFGITTLPLRSPRLSRLQARLGAALTLWRRTLSDWRFLLRYGLFTTLITAFGVAVLVQSFTVFGAQLPLDAAILLFALLSLVWLVPIVPGNLGVLELVCGSLAVGLGLTLTQGMMAVALMRASELLMVMIVALPAGAIAAFRTVGAHPLACACRYARLQGAVAVAPYPRPHRPMSPRHQRCPLIPPPPP